MTEDQVSKSPSEIATDDLYGYHAAEFLKDAEKDPAKAVERFGFTIWHTVAPEKQMAIREKLGIKHTTANQLYDCGTLAAQNGDFAGAEPHLRAALEKDPDHGLAAYNLAFCLEQLGRKKDARKAYEQYLEIIDRATGRVDLRMAADGDLDEEKARILEHVEALGK